MSSMPDMTEEQKQVHTIHTIEFKDTFKRVPINAVYDVVFQSSLLSQDARLIKQSQKQIHIARTQQINKYIASLLKTENLSIPYDEIIDVDIQINKRFLVKASVHLNQYSLHIGILYKLNAETQHVDVLGKVKIYGVKDKLLRKIAGEIIRAQYKLCRKHEKKMLKEKGFK